MGFFDKFFDGSAAKKVTGPEAAPAAAEPEAKREVPEAPVLTVLEGGKDVEVAEGQAEAVMSDSKFWLLKAEEASKAAAGRFQAASKFFREQKAEGKTDSAKWDKESSRYLAWMEAAAQNDCAQRLKAETGSLEGLKAELAALPDMPMLSAPERAKVQLSYSFDDAVKNMNTKSRLSSKIRTQDELIQNLQIQFAGHELEMQKHDAVVAGEEATLLAVRQEAEAKAAAEKLTAAENEKSAAAKLQAEETAKKTAEAKLAQDKSYGLLLGQLDKAAGSSSREAKLEALKLASQVLGDPSYEKLTVSKDIDAALEKAAKVAEGKDAAVAAVKKQEMNDKAYAELKATKYTELMSVYKELEAAQAEMAAQKGNFLGKALFLFGIRTKEQKAAAQRLKAAEASEKSTTRAYVDEFVPKAGYNTDSPGARAIASQRARSAQYQEDMRHAGGLW